MQRQFLLPIFFLILSTPLFILSADILPADEKEEAQKTKEIETLKDLIAIAEGAASNAVAASTSFTNFVKYIKAGKVRVRSKRIL